MMKAKRMVSGLVSLLAVLIMATGCSEPEDNLWGAGPSRVSLGDAGNFVILAKSEISTIPNSVITGDVGLSPAAESYMSGFAQTKATGYSTSAQVTGFLYASDMTSPTPSKMTTAVSDMESAYTDAAGRSKPDFLDLSTGAIGGLTLQPGLYKWNSTVTVPADVTISGKANDTWIFQINGDLSVASAARVILSGGAKAKNIVWQVTGTVSLGPNSHFEGIILSQTSITMETSSSMYGRALAQSNVALDQAIIIKPAN